MPVTAPDRLRVIGRDGTVIFDGAGAVIVGLDPGAPRGVPFAHTLILRIHEGDYRAQMDLTGLVHAASWSFDYDVPGVEWDPGADPLMIPDPPRIRAATLALDIPGEGAAALRRYLYQGHPDHQPVPRSVLPRTTSQICADLYARGMVREESIRADLAARVPDPAATEELIRSTRAEFPRDPYRYGANCPAGPMRWTPPEDPDEEIRPCP